MSYPTTLYEFYTSIGSSLPPITDRALVYESFGLGTAAAYTGSAEQNTALLDALVGGSQPALDPVAALDSVKDFLTGYTVGQWLADASSFDPDFLNQMLLSSGVSADDYQQGLDIIGQFPSSISLYDALVDLLMESTRAAELEPGGFGVPSEIEWSSGYESAGSYESPAFAFDADTGEWSLRDITDDSLSGVPVDELRFYAGQGWAALKEGALREATNNALELVEHYIPAPMFNLLNNTFTATSDAQTIKEVVGDWQNHMFDEIGKGFNAVSSDDPWDGGAAAWEHTTDFQHRLMDFVLSKTGVLGELVASSFGYVRTISLHSDIQFLVQDAQVLENYTVPEGHRGVIVAADAGDSITGAAGADRLIGLGGNDVLNGAGGNDELGGNAGDDTLRGGEGDDTLSGGTGNDNIDGGEGVDTALYGAARSHFTPLAKTVDGDTLTDIWGTEGTDTLVNVERLQFTDTNLALDLDGHAGQTAKLLGAVFGAASVANKQYVGIGLSLLDGGMGYEELASLAMSVTGKTSHADIVALLWTNLFDSAPTAEQAAPVVGLLDAGMSVGTLTVLAAELSLNAQHINLVGLSSTGLEYVL